MLLVPKNDRNPLEEVNSYDGATTLLELVAALSKPDREDDWHDWNQLKHPTPSPESKIGGTIENPEQFAELMAIYSATRTAISGPLVQQVMKDMVAYDEASDRHTALAGTAYMARLAAAATSEASASMRFTKEEIAKMTLDANAPPPTSLHFIVYSQRHAADVSIEVYHIACDMIDAVVSGGSGGAEGAAAAAAVKGAYCIAGGVKEDRRILFKSFFKYGGVFSNCRDLSRLTICVLNLTAAAILAEAIHKHPLLLVIRCKNRYAASVNTSDAGGYRDFQMLCMYKHGGRHHFFELQINLVEMVAIKAGEGGGGDGDEGEGAASAAGGGGTKKSKKEETDDVNMAGGHEVFETARVIDVFSKRSLEYSGDPSDALWKMIAAGSLLRVNLDQATMTDAQVKQLVEAMESTQCRVKELSMVGCGEGITTIPEGLWVLLEASKVRQSNPDVLDLSQWGDLETLPETGVAGLVNLEALDLEFCSKLKQLPQSIAKLAKLKTLNLDECENLAEPLPDLSHLLPGLKIEVFSASAAAKAWEKRGFTSLANRGKIMKMLADGTLHTYTGTVLNLTGSDVKTLPDSLGKLTHLKTLNLRECENLETLPETGVAGLVNLEELNLRYCRELKQLPQSIAKLTKLKTLDLLCNLAEPLPDLSPLLPGLEIKCTAYPSAAARAWKRRGFTSLANRKKTMKMLADGTLHTHADNVLTLAKSDVATLPDSLSQLTHLKMLNLNYCYKLEALPETGVAGLVNLEELDLRDCSKLKQLPQSIAKLTKLKTLDLWCCTNLAEPLPDLSHLVPGLEIKDYDSDAAKAWKKRGFTSLANRGKMMKMIADGTLHTYTDALLTLAGSYIETLPDSLGKLTHLKTLYLEGCRILKTLPETVVAGLVNLEVLNLEGCTKLKQLPQSIAKLTKLKTLDLKYCRRLSEPLPDLSHLLPGLKIEIRIKRESSYVSGFTEEIAPQTADYASDAVKAWEKRGFTSLAN